MLHCPRPKQPRYIRKDTVLAAAKNTPVAMIETRQIATAYLASRRRRSGTIRTSPPHSFPESALEILAQPNKIGEDNGRASQPKRKSLELAIDLDDCLIIHKILLHLPLLLIVMGEVGYRLEGLLLFGRFIGVFANSNYSIPQLECRLIPFSADRVTDPMQLFKSNIGR